MYFSQFGPFLLDKDNVYVARLFEGGKSSGAFRCVPFRDVE